MNRSRLWGTSEIGTNTSHLTSRCAERALHVDVRVLVGVGVGVVQRVAAHHDRPVVGKAERADPADHVVQPAQPRMAGREVAVDGLVHQRVVRVGGEGQDRRAQPQRQEPASRGRRPSNGQAGSSHRHGQRRPGDRRREVSWRRAFLRPASRRGAKLPLFMS